MLEDLGRHEVRNLSIESVDFSYNINAREE